MSTGKMSEDRLHASLDDAARDQAALHALGALDPAEVRAYELHLGVCAPCRDEVAALRRVTVELALAAPSVTPPQDLRARVLAGLSGTERESKPQPWKAWSATAPGMDSIFVPSGPEAWEETSFAGVQARKLFVDPAANRITMLVRMAPGSAYPAHVHGGPEECYVLAGDLRVGELHMHAGDYQRVAQGASHPVQSTDTGCLLFLISALDDELLTTA